MIHQILRRDQRALYKSERSAIIKPRNSWLYLEPLDNSYVQINSRLLPVFAVYLVILGLIMIIFRKSVKQFHDDL